MAISRPIAVIAVTALLAALTGAAAPTTLAGTAKVIDGDTIEVDGTRIRLFAIDAPESQQLCLYGKKTWDCGQRSAEALKAFLGNSEVTCQRRLGSPGTSYGRKVLACFKGNEDIGEHQVRNGWAFAYREYGMDYVPAEDRARQESKGAWSSMFLPPAEWRKRHQGAHLHPRSHYLD